MEKLTVIKKGQPLNNKVKKTMSGSIFNLSIKRPF